MISQFIGYVFLRLVIGLKLSRHILSQSEVTAKAKNCDLHARFRFPALWIHRLELFVQFSL